MTDTITLNDGTVSRAYEKLAGPVTTNPSKGIVVHVRKTAERDATPETLTIRQESPDAKTRRTTVTLSETKIDSVTGKAHVARAWIGIDADTVHFSQAEVEAKLTALAAFLAVSGIKTDLAVGRV